MDGIANVAGHMSTAGAMGDYAIAETTQLMGEWKSGNGYMAWNALKSNQQAWRIARVFGNNGGKVIDVLGHVGTGLGIISTGYSYYKVANQITNGGIESVNALDAADAVVGTLGTAASIAGTVATIVGVATPVGWVVIGAGATIYGVIRLGMFIYDGK